MAERDTSFAAFSQAVKESVEVWAKRKNYRRDDGSNPLMDFKRYLGITTGHHIGEICNKLAEYMVDRRRVILVKVCGWIYLEWMDCEKE